MSKYSTHQKHPTFTLIGPRITARRGVSWLSQILAKVRLEILLRSKENNVEEAWKEILRGLLKTQMSFTRKQAILWHEVNNNAEGIQSSMLQYEKQCDVTSDDQNEQ